MTDNLRNLKKELKAFAKRVKDFKYTDSALIVFLLTGMIGIGGISFNLYSAEDEIKTQEHAINTSILQLQKDFKRARQENNRLLRTTNLELIQLMEQGDHVVKSPWSSWQYGINYVNNNWNGTYKGRGDKKEKYPYEGVFERSADPYERYIAPNSKNYSLLGRNRNPRSASSNNRQGLSGYGIASTLPAREPIVAFEVNAGIRPKTVNKSPITIAAKTANVPQLPNTVSFVPPVVNLPSIQPGTPSTPSVHAPATGNGYEKFVSNLAGSGQSVVARVAVNEINKKGNAKGLITVTTDDTSSFTYSGATAYNTKFKTENVKFVASGDSTFTYDTDIPETSYGSFAFAKLVEGIDVNVDNVKINFNGAGYNNGTNYAYSNWLFHTDGHNGRSGGGSGDSNWIIGPGSEININGKGLTMWASQRHSFTTDNYISFQNNGKIAIGGDHNIGWIALDEYGNHKPQYFWNKNGEITLSGNHNTLAYIMARTPSTSEGGWHFINDGDITIGGSNQSGIVVGTNYDDYKESSIILNKPIKITGTDSVGIYFPKFVNLAGGDVFTTSPSDNKQTALGTEDATTNKTTTKESVIKLNLSGSDNIGTYFDYSGTNGFELKDYTLEADGTKDTLVYIKDGKVTLAEKNSANNINKININGGNKNVGIYTISGKDLDTAATVTLTGASESVGLYAKNASGTIKNTGKISGTGLTQSMGIAAESTGTATTITNEGEVDVEGTGVVGLVAKGAGATLKSEGANSKIKATGGSSASVYADNGTVTLKGGSVDAEGGAIDLYANNNGTINVSDSGTATAINTGQKSLAFMTANGGKINFASATTATIQGGSDAPSRGTAFYYTPSGLSVTPGTASTYGSFSNLGTDLGAAFNGSLGNLTLDMKNGSRLMIASNINASLANTTDAAIRAALPGLNFTSGSTDYKTAMLYLSYLNVDKNVNLDDANDDYNKLEISNSSIENNSTVTGTQAGQVAMAQENIYNNPVDIKWVTLTNNGAINLSGANSTGMYAKFGVIKNTKDITVGDSGTGIYGTDNSQINNTGTITMGSNSTGMYYDDARNSTVTTTDMTNNGTIKSTGSNSVGMSYNHIGGNITTFENAGTIELTGDKNTGMYATGDPGYNAINSGTIKMGDSASLNNPNVALYTSDTTNATKLINKGNIETGAYTIGIFGNQSENSGNITVGDGAIGIYSQTGNVDLTGGKIKLGGKEAVGVYTVGGGQIITNSNTDFDIADSSYGFVNLNTSGTGNTIISSKPNLTLGNDVVYIYSNDTAGTVNNSSNVTSTGGKDYVIYSAGTVTNSGNLNLTSGAGNVGIYSIKGGTATNTGTITIGASNAGAGEFSIGMAAGYQNSDTGNVVNNGTINVNGDFSIGMYASGAGSTATNNKNIVLNGDNTTGIYADNGAKAINTGNISTGSGSYANVVGVFLGKGSTLNNTGNITIDGVNSVGVYLKGGKVVNYGNITVNGSSRREDVEYTFTTPPTGKGVGGTVIDAPAGAQTATVTINGVKQTPVVINTFAKNPIEVSASSIGLYVNTSGKDYTNSINGLGNLTQEADLIIGTEATELTNSRTILIKDPKILDPYNNAIKTSGVKNWNIYSGGLNWIATPTLNPNDGTMTSIYMAKIPYTAWAGQEDTPVNSTDTYNFLDGLEQRYGVEDLGTRERQLFQKLNGIGNNEEILFYQATDEMMGHQYGNLQQRINETGGLLDKEFSYLKNDWRNPSKENNKIKVFGMRNEYNSDTAGIIDYTSNAYGVAYVHEDETVRLGNSSGWYAGAVNNRFKFKDIGKSKENQTMVRAGLFKTMTPAKDYNGSLRWTIAGDVFAGRNEMKRRFLVVDDIFNAKADYTSYGAAFKTDLGYDVRLSERAHLRPYGALKMEYGRFTNIKEDSGEIRLEVDGNDYFSVKPEVGLEFKYVQPMALKTNLSVGLAAAYENELGRVANGKNKARVRYTEADWFGVRGEKENRRGNGKFDLNVGIDNTRFGVTVNAGYDTKGENVRGGLGFRLIY